MVDISKILQMLCFYMKNFINVEIYILDKNKKVIDMKKIIAITVLGMFLLMSITAFSIAGRNIENFEQTKVNTQDGSDISILSPSDGSSGDNPPIAFEIEGYAAGDGYTIDFGRKIEKNPDTNPGVFSWDWVTYASTVSGEFSFTYNFNPDCKIEEFIVSLFDGPLGNREGVAQDQVDLEIEDKSKITSRPVFSNILLKVFDSKPNILPLFRSLINLALLK